MIQPPNNFVAVPQFRDLLELVKRELMLTMNCHHLATVTKVDITKKTLRATINYMQTYYMSNARGEQVQVNQSYPVVIDVPYIRLGGKESGLFYPIEEGSQCLLIYNDRDISNWVKKSYNGPVATSRLHSFSDAIALVGFSDLEDDDPDRIGLRYGTTQVAVGEDKILIENADHTLNEVLQDLASAVEDLASAAAAITVTCTTPGNPSSVPLNATAINLAKTAIEDAATAIGELLE